MQYHQPSMLRTFRVLLRSTQQLREEDRTQEQKKMNSADPIATKEMCAYCFDTLISHFSGKELPPFPFDEITTCPMFVTLNIVRKTIWSSEQEKELRGCIGSLSPRPLVDLSYFAKSSAFNDRRFSPLEERELSDLQICISLLVCYENGTNYLDWAVFINHWLYLNVKSSSGRDSWNHY
jgi:AMMECR1 domain-containing protein